MAKYEYLKFKTNVPQDVCFINGSQHYEPKKSDYGWQIAYVVKVDGETLYWSTTPMVHAMIQAINPEKAEIIGVTREEDGPKKFFVFEGYEDTEPDRDILDSLPKDDDDEPKAKKAEPKAQKRNGREEPPKRESEEPKARQPQMSYKDYLDKYFQVASDVTTRFVTSGIEPSSEDVRAVTTHIMMAAGNRFSIDDIAVTKPVTTKVKPKAEPEPDVLSDSEDETTAEEQQTSLDVIKAKFKRANVHVTKQVPLIRHVTSDGAKTISQLVKSKGLLKLVVSTLDSIIKREATFDEVMGVESDLSEDELPF